MWKGGDFAVIKISFYFQSDTLPFKKLSGEQGIGSLGKGEQRQQGLGRKQEVSNTAAAGAAEMLPAQGSLGFVPACSVL